LNLSGTDFGGDTEYKRQAAELKQAVSESLLANNATAYLMVHYFTIRSVQFLSGIL
jgi:hypothetical protein